MWLPQPLTVGVPLNQKILKRRLFGEAGKIYRTLIDRNSENCSYHHKLEECLMLDSEEARLAHYKQMAADFPRSHVIRRMPLLITTGKIGVKFSAREP